MSNSWATGWATNDVVPAAEFAKGTGSVADSTLVSDAANINLASLPTLYAHLRVVAYLRTDEAVAMSSAAIQFNGDTTANYDYQSGYASASTQTDLEVFAASSIGLGGCPGASAGANLFSCHVVDVIHYAGSTNNKVVTIQTAVKTGTSTGNMRIQTIAGFWRSNAAINRVTIIPGGGTVLKAGSRVTVYVSGA